MTRERTPALRLERLEDRATPAVFGEPWLDGRHLTLSFANDGTSISGVGSTLNAALSTLGTDAAKLELLRAFQSWAVHANMNVGLVADSNWKFGAAAAIQGDPRFGDIRIGARPLNGDVVAITAPFSLLTQNSGDLILNSNKQFIYGTENGKYDLYTIALQESGHAFGIGNSLNTASVMYEIYGTARAGLHTSDVNEIRALYGTRGGDAYEGGSGNGSLETATNYSAALEADLTTTADIDTYRFTATSSAGRWFRIKAAGLSLVGAKLEILDATGQVIGSEQATNPMQNDVTVHIEELVAGGSYYLRVSSARSDVFGVGAYRLVVDATSEGDGSGDPYALVDLESSANNDLATATNVAASGGPFDYSFRSSLSASLDVDFYKVRAPATPSGTTNFNITVSAVGESWFTPHVEVYDAAGVKLAAKIVAQTDSSVVLSLQGAAANADYFVRVASTFRQAGNYDIVADFRTGSLPNMLGSNGKLNSTVRSTSATLNIHQSQTIQVNLLANLQNGADFVGLVRIYDYLNRVVFEMCSITGILSTGTVFLRRAVYRVEVESLGGVAVDYKLTLFGVSDPVGSSPTDPTGDPSGGSGDPPPPPPPPNDSTTITVVPPPAPPPDIIWF